MSEGSGSGLSMRAILKNISGCQRAALEGGLSGQRRVTRLPGNHVSIEKKSTWIPFTFCFKCDFQGFYKKCNAPTQVSRGNWFPSIFSLPQWNGLVLIQSPSLMLTPEACWAQWHETNCWGSRGQDRNNWRVYGESLCLSRGAEQGSLFMSQ